MSDKWRMDERGDLFRDGMYVVNIGQFATGVPRKEEALAELLCDANSKAALRNTIREEITLLRQWAHESQRGGWSTHQVEPMRRRADRLEQEMMGD